MFSPFADPLLAAAQCRLSPLRPSPSRPKLCRELRRAFPASPCVSRFHASAAVKQTAFLVRSDAQSTCGKAPPSSMSCRETAAPWLIRYGVAHLLSCAATSMIDRGRRLTDEAFRTRVGKPSAGSSGWLFHSSRLCGTPELCCGPQIGAAERLGSIPGPDPNRSWATIQVIFCVPELCKTHDRALARSARGIPVRSGDGLSTASPATEKSAATALAWPAPSSTTIRPFAASSRPASAVIVR